MPDPINPIDPRLLFPRFFQVVDGDNIPSAIGIAATRIVEIFDRAVDDLRSPQRFPNPHINKLMTLAWRGIGRRPQPLIYTVAMENIPHIHFFTERHPSGAAISALCFPLDWPTQAKNDPYMTLGGIIWACSQAIDFSFGRFHPHQGVKDRAIGREAEFYRTVITQTRPVQDMAGRVPNFALNEYMQKVLEMFPLGLNSIPDHYHYGFNLAELTLEWPVPALTRDFLAIDAAS